MTWRIVGSTLRPGASELPRRLPPVFEGPDGVPVVAIAGGDEPPGAPDDPDFVRLADDAYDRFDSPLVALPDHIVVRFVMDGAPVLLPRAELDERLDACSKDAIVRCARCVVDGRGEEALDAAWYAARARPDRPLPMLLVIALLRQRHQSEDAELFVHRIPGELRGLPANIEGALKSQTSARRALLELLGEHTPERFDPLPNVRQRDRSFLRRMRASLGHAQP